MPEFVTRAEWGATASTLSPRLDSWEGWILHWMDAKKVGDTDPAALMRVAERYHEKTQGWRDIAYHVAVGRDGAVLQGRDLGRMGGATKGKNKTTMSLVFLLGEGELTPEAISSAKWVMHIHAPLRGYPFRFAGHHSEWGSTACPGAQIRSVAWGASEMVPEESDVSAPEAYTEAQLVAASTYLPIVRLAYAAANRNPDDAGVMYWCLTMAGSKSPGDVFEYLRKSL